MENQSGQSCGVLFLYLIGTKENGNMYTVQVNSYQHPLNFYEQAGKLRNIGMTEDSLELFCVLGIPQKIEPIAAGIRLQIRENMQNLMEGKELRIRDESQDFLTAEFDTLIQERIFCEEALGYPREHWVKTDEWNLYCVWIGGSPEDEGHFQIECALDIWLRAERPFVAGKQIMIQSFQLSDLYGRRGIGALAEKEDLGWYLVLEGGLKLYLNQEIPYMRERIGARELDISTVGDVDKVICDPAYALGTHYEPLELCEEWHKVFFFALAVSENDWNRESLIPVYERFLNFLSKRVCNTMYAQIEKLIETEVYWEVLLKHIGDIRGYLSGKEETVISKDFLVLLNSHYRCLPYLYPLIEEACPALKAPKEPLEFQREVFLELIHASETRDNYWKGLNWETVSEYVLSHIDGLKVVGKRIQTGFHEIDLSAANISLDASLWEMGGYFLIECKNWKKKADIRVIRGLAHISSMKGNKTTLLFSANGITKEAEKEILRAAVNQTFILCFTKEDLLKLHSNEDCYNLLIQKWRELAEQTGKELII